MTQTLAPLVGFCRFLRSQGLPVGTGRILNFCRAASLLSPLTKDRLARAGRLTLVAHPSHVARYNELFDSYFGRGALMETLANIGASLPAPEEPRDLPELSPDADTGEKTGWRYAEGRQGGEEEGGVVALIASRAEILRHKSFEQLTEDERRAARKLISQLKLGLPTKRSRRLRAARKGHRFDVRRTLRSSLRTQGEPFARQWRAPRISRRSLVLVLDISGSMEPYARALIQFGHAAMTSGRRVDVYCFGTRLTRVTRALRVSDPGRALEAAAEVVQDWAGGTRIGDALKSLLDGYTSSAAVRGSIVVLCSDGLERGEPDTLGAQMERLHRLAYRVVWVNPLKGSPYYSPLARGMAAALPHVDSFVAGHNVASLEDLAALLSEQA